MTKEKKINATGLLSVLTGLYGFANDAQTAKALGIPKGTGNHLNSGRAGRSLKNAYQLVIALSDALPEKKRLKILSNMNLVVDI